MNISYSRVAAYMACPFSHYLGYELGIKSNKPIRPLHFGSDFHKLLEARRDPDKLDAAKMEIAEQYYAIPASWQGELGENYLENLFDIFQDYQEVYKDARLPTKTEVEFHEPLFEEDGEPYYFHGFIDGVYLRKSKKTGEKSVIIEEHKTFSRRPDLETLTLNTQKNLYAVAAIFLYKVFPSKVIWDYIASTPAMSPVWLEKSQKFSESAAHAQKITPFSWLRALKEKGITDPAMVAKAEEYRGNIPAYFFRVEQEYDKATVNRVWEGFLYQARLIAKYGKENKTQNFTRNCSFCKYKDICYTLMTGGSLDRLMEKDFSLVPREDVVTERRRAADPLFDPYFPPEYVPF